MNIREAVLKYQEKIFPLLDIALNGINYFFHIFCSWYISQQSYGTLNALLSILAILLVAGISFQTFTAKEVARNGVGAKRIYKTAFIYIICLSLIFILAIDWINEFTRSSYLSLGILLAVFILNLFLSILRGIFQGERQFFNLNISFYVENLVKMVFVLLLLPVFNRLEIVLLSLLLGMTAAIFHGIIKLNVKNIRIPGEGSVKPVVKQLGIIYLSNFFIYYFTSIDMVIFNYRLHEISGIYAVVLRYSQIILFISFSLITVFIPNLSSQTGNSQLFLKRVKKYFLLLAVTQVILLTAYKTVFPLSVVYLFGAEYLKASEYLLKGAVMYIMLVNSFYLVNVNIILDRKRYVFCLGATAVFMTGFLLNYGRSIDLFLYGGIVIYTLLFLILTAMFYYEGVKADERIKEGI